MSLMRMIVKVGIDATEYTIGLKKIESGIDGLAKAAAKAFTVGAITHYTMKVANAVATISDLADQLELTTLQVQILQRAALASGVSFDAYANALNKIKKAQADFSSGDKSAEKLFGRLGVNPNMPAFDILRQIGFTEDKAALFELLGVKSARLFNSLKDIRDLGALESIPEQVVRDVDKVMDRAAEGAQQTLAIMIRIAAVMSAINQAPTIARDVAAGMIRDKIFGPKAKDPDPEEEMRWSPHVESETRTPFPYGYTKAGRSSGWAGPRQLEKSFSKIDLGDRANVGGFFGPNADTNRKMQQSLDSINNEIKGISKVVVGAAQTAP